MRGSLHRLNGCINKSAQSSIHQLACTSWYAQHVLHGTMYVPLVCDPVGAITYTTDTSCSAVHWLCGNRQLDWQYCLPCLERVYNGEFADIGRASCALEDLATA